MIRFMIRLKYNLVETEPFYSSALPILNIYHMKDNIAICHWRQAQKDYT